MPWFKTINNRVLQLIAGNVEAALSFGTDSAGKQIVIGKQTALASDSNFSNGTPSNYGKGSIVFLTAGGIRIVDTDGYWQSPTVTAASPSASPSSSVSPSTSVSPSVSRSASPSVSPSASGSPSHSASPST